MNTGLPSSVRVTNGLHAAALHPAALLRLEAVCALTGLSRSTVYAKIAEGRFPAPMTDGPRWSRWRAGDVIAWLESVA